MAVHDHVRRIRAERGDFQQFQIVFRSPAVDKADPHPFRNGKILRWGAFVG